MRFLLALLFLFSFPAYQVCAQSPGYTLNEDLIYRINFGSAEDVRVLLAKGADPNTRSRQGESALNIAIARNDAETVGMALALIDKGASITAPDKAGNPVIFNAIRYKQPAIVKAIIDKGFDYHSTSADGVPLIDYAQRNNDTESVKIIQPLLDKENAYAASMRTTDRFKGLVHDYINDSCVYQYWSYFLASRQAPEKDDETNKKIAAIKNALADIITNIQKYYPSTSNQLLHQVSADAVNQIFGQLDGMISNRNRAEKGVGSDEDARSRCDKVVESIHMDFASPPGTTTGEQPSTASQGNLSSVSKPASKGPTPLPVDPTISGKGKPY